MSKTDRSDGVYLLHIVESLQDVLDFLAGKDYEEFIDSKLLVNAVVRSFEIAGEAAMSQAAAISWASGVLKTGGTTGTVIEGATAKLYTISSTDYLAWFDAITADQATGMKPINDALNGKTPVTDSFWAMLKDKDFFRQVTLDHGVLTWPNGVDIAPEEVWEDSVCESMQIKADFA